MPKILLVVAAVAASLSYALDLDPCTLAASSQWVQSEIAHACELTLPFDKRRSLKILDTALKSLPYYSLETYFLHSPNPRIPRDVNIRALLEDVRRVASSEGYETDWAFNLAVTDAFNRLQDGHTVYVADCTQAFSWNLPFSISTLAPTPSSHPRAAYPVLLANFDFPTQNRTGLEAYYQRLGFADLRRYDGARVLSIDGVDAGAYLTRLADASSIYDGLVGGFESFSARYMRLMSRYSADSESGMFTQEVGRFGQRSFYPGTDSVTFCLETASGNETLTIPWAATMVGKGNSKASFIAKNCALAEGSSKRSAPSDDAGRKSPRRAVISPDAQQEVRLSANRHRPDSLRNYVQPNLTSYGHFVTLDIYRLTEHPHVGVVYFEQFEPSTRYDYRTYFRGIARTLYDGLTSLKKAGVRHVLIDISGNRGGYINVGAIALWSLWPTDLYPGFPSVFRVGNDLIRRESASAADRQDAESEYFYGNYMSTKYHPLTSSAQFMDPPVGQLVNGVPDNYSHPFMDFFGNTSAAVTKFKKPPFAPKDYVLVSNGICASTCSIFSSYLFQKHGVRSAVFGGTAAGARSSSGVQFDAGVKGAEVTSLESILSELDNADLKHDGDAPRAFPVRASLSLNFRNAIPYVDAKKDGILEFVWEEATREYQFTKELYNNPQKLWEFVAEEFYGS
ncbi:hypothetical protein MKEN_00852000 [Mycena kentingensis (nom. inval.)]|nr:hypothetical protein MKEN_00852000 [Mycena kentingensis (nom. inval.)]